MSKLVEPLDPTNLVRQVLEVPLRGGKFTLVYVWPVGNGRWLVQRRVGSSNKNVKDFTGTVEEIRQRVSELMGLDPKYGRYPKKIKKAKWVSAKLSKHEIQRITKKGKVGEVRG